MSKRDYKLFLSDILDCIEKIEEYISDLTFNDFDKNTMVSDAVLRNLEIIAEAIKNLPPEITQKHPQVPWKKVIGFRNVVLHAYFTVDLKNVWYVITEQLPELKVLIEKIAEEERKKG